MSKHENKLTPAPARESARAHEYHVHSDGQDIFIPASHAIFVIYQQGDTYRLNVKWAYGFAVMREGSYQDCLDAKRQLQEMGEIQNA